MSSTLNDDEKELCNRLLNALRNESEDIFSAVLSSEDGLLLAHSSQPEAEVEEDAIAAMSASLLSLADALAGQAGQAISKKLISESADSSLVILHAGDMILTVIGAAGTNIGMLLQASQHVVKIIEKDLSEFAARAVKAAASNPSGLEFNVASLFEKAMQEVEKKRAKKQLKEKEG